MGDLSPHHDPSQSAHPFSEIAGYRLLGTLGSGGFATTFKAEKAGALYAVKLFHELPFGVDAIRFDREVETLQLDHPNLVRYEDHGVAEYGGLQRPYIAMPYTPGQTLRALIDANTGGIKCGEAAGVGAAIADGLAFLHERNIAHRDLTPKNVYITNAGDVLLLDFGLVRLQDQTSLTLKGQVLGTLAYCSPEQLRDEPDLHTDIYGLGATLYHALTGQVPFPAKSPEALFQMIRDEEPEPPSIRNPLVPDELDGLVQAMLAKEPVQRPASATAVGEALRRPQEAARAKPTPYARDSDPVLAVRATTRSAARALLGAAMTGEVPDLAVGAVTTPPVLDELVRAAGFDPQMRLAIDTKVETTAGAVMPKVVKGKAYAPKGQAPYGHRDLRASETSDRVAREDVREQDTDGASAFRSACFSFSGPEDPWIKRDTRLLGTQLHARDAVNAEAPLFAMVRCDIDSLVKRDDRLLIANRFSRGAPDGYWFDVAGLSVNSAPEVIAGAFEMFLLMQERGVPALASLPGPLVELAWSVGIGGVEIKLGRVGGWHGASVHVRRTGDTRPRFEFPSIFCSFLPDAALDLLQLDVLPESSCSCAACRLAAEPEARIAIADTHGLAAWLELRRALTGLSISDRVGRLKGRFDEAERLLADVRGVSANQRYSPRHIRNLRAALDTLEQTGAFGPVGKLRRVA